MFAWKKPAQADNASELFYDDRPMPRAAIKLDGQELRMLLVEDQPSDVLLAEEMLEECMPDYQWHVIDKPSVANAVSLLHHIKFDVALVDLTLQDMQGAETVATLRMAAPDLPIVVYSGSGDLEMLQEALSKGAQFCIEKGAMMPKVVRAMLQCALSPEMRY